MKNLIKKLIEKDKVKELEEIKASITRQQPTTSEITYLNMINDYLSGRKIIISLIKEKAENIDHGTRHVRFTYDTFDVDAEVFVKHIQEPKGTHTPELDYKDIEVLKIGAVINDVY